MVKVKICGLSRIEDIDAVNRALPDYIGFVFAPSRRRVDDRTAAILKEKLDPRIKAVGVFVNQDIEDVAKLYKKGVIDVAQLHGDEDGEYIKLLRKIAGIQIIKSIGIGNELPPLPDEPDYLLFDTLSAQRGGTGKIFNWHIIKHVTDRPYFLAGGLTLENITKANRILDPYCVDVSSGVETNGIKDAKKIHTFVRFVRDL